MATRTYVLTVEGELGDHLASAFPGMMLSHEEGMTTLTGPIRDQAELQGVLQRITDLGLTLIETKVITDRDVERLAAAAASDRAQKGS